nr:hypothetical protein [Tanacetum cinerariifolium]
MANMANALSPFYSITFQYVLSTTTKTLKVIVDEVIERMSTLSRFITNAEKSTWPTKSCSKHDQELEVSFVSETSEDAEKPLQHVDRQLHLSQTPEPELCRDSFIYLICGLTCCSPSYQLESSSAQFQIESLHFLLELHLRSCLIVTEQLLSRLHSSGDQVSRVLSLWSNPNKEPKLGRSCRDELGTFAGEGAGVCCTCEMIGMDGKGRVVADNRGSSAVVMTGTSTRIVDSKIKSISVSGLGLSMFKTKIMATTIEQQTALDESLVPSSQRLRIGRSNFRLPSDIQSKEATLQVVYDVLTGEF